MCRTGLPAATFSRTGEKGHALVASPEAGRVRGEALRDSNNPDPGSDLTLPNWLDSLKSQ